MRERDVSDFHSKTSLKAKLLQMVKVFSPSVEPKFYHCTKEKEIKTENERIKREIMME
jgi:hypothetical protein